MPSSTVQPPKFAEIPPDNWTFSADASATVRAALLNAPAYPDIVEQIAEMASLVSFKRERSKRDPDYFRLSATLRCRSPSPVTLFHSAATGYRAQYFSDIGLGERANRYAVEVLGGVLLGLIGLSPKRTCTEPWLDRTLADSDAKVWIHQGTWLRSPRPPDKLLRIERWTIEAAQDRASRKRARYAQLVPRDEDRIDFKGGFVRLDGTSLGTYKPDRSNHIHEQGFT